MALFICPTPAYQDTSFLMHRSRFVQSLNVSKRTPRLNSPCGLAERPC
jgi:hypothetical protein